MKIDRKFLEQLTGSLSKDKAESESKEFGNIFNIINKINPKDNKIDIEEMTKFAASIWQEDNGDGKISNNEIENYIQKNQTDFRDTGIKAKDIKKFFEFFIKNSDKTPDNNIRVDNGDGTYSVITQREEFEEQRIVTNQKEIDEWNTRNNENDLILNQDNENQDINPEIGFSNSKPPSDKRPEPVYETNLISKGLVTRKINYNSKNQITTIEETRGNVTTITDADGKILQTITKNDGAKDTIKDYTILDDGTKEETVFYGENGVKDSQHPAYKNVYKNNTLVAKYEYDSNGNIIQRQNIENGVVYSVTKYNNGVESETIQLFTNSNSFAKPDIVFDNIIDPAMQSANGDCWIIDGLSSLNRKDWGRDAIRDAISYDSSNGNITIKLKHAYGETKEFVITSQELEDAKHARAEFYDFDLKQGDTVYIDGKLELQMSRDGSYSFDADKIKDNITVVNKNGEKNIYHPQDLRISNSLARYSTDDLTILAIELAVERSRQEVGLPLCGGTYEEVLALFTDTDKIQIYRNSNLINQSKQEILLTKSEQEEDELYQIQSNKLLQHIEESEHKVDSQGMLQQIKKIMQNPDKYSCGLSLKMDSGLHAGQILRFENIDGKDYIVYTHSWDEQAEIREELTSFVNNTLASIRVVEKPTNNQIDISLNSQIETFRMGNKSNRTNFASVIANLVQNTNFKPDIQKEGDNYIITIKGERITITPNEFETARVSGRYSNQDDDISLLEIAVERYINKIRHNNTISDVSHTNLEDVKIQDILNLFSDSELEQEQTTDLSEASKKNGLKFAVAKIWDEENWCYKTTYYSIKEIKQAPNGNLLISVIQPEDTSVIVTYTEEEYKRIFGSIEIYN